MKWCFYLIVVFVTTGLAAEIPEKLNDAIKLQVLLDRANFSPGEIDGSIGPRTRKTLTAFQQAHQLETTGEPDEPTIAALEQTPLSDPLITYTITANDVKGPFLERIPHDFMEQAKLPHLGYTSPLEALAEKFHASGGLLKRLNPNVQFDEGDEILVPNVLNEADENQTQTAPNSNNGTKIVVSETDSALTVESSNGEILFYAPATAGSEKDPLPLGNWQISRIIKDPEFFYNPELFWDADPSHSKAKLQPGPNNPVGVVWIDIDKEHYGIHGSPDPSKIGKTESHGCVRLTNWDVQKLTKYAKRGTQVIFR